MSKRQVEVVEEQIPAIMNLYEGDLWREIFNHLCKGDKEAEGNYMLRLIGVSHGFHQLLLPMIWTKIRTTLEWPVFLCRSDALPIQSFLETCLGEDDDDGGALKYSLAQSILCLVALEAQYIPHVICLETYPKHHPKDGIKLVDVVFYDEREKKVRPLLSLANLEQEPMPSNHHLLCLEYRNHKRLCGDHRKFDYSTLKDEWTARGYIYDDMRYCAYSTDQCNDDTPGVWHRLVYAGKHILGEDCKWYRSHSFIYDSYISLETSYRDRQRAVWLYVHQEKHSVKILKQIVLINKL